jgi:6-phosphogluconolactonase (cycloisomerase 2 family)
VAQHNHLSALRIDPSSGALAHHGEPVTLPHRAVHICLDSGGRFVLSAHNVPKSGITVDRINADGTIGDRVLTPQPLDYGIYPHQVRMMPSDKAAILVDRGNDAEGGKPEDPGALRVFRRRSGSLSPVARKRSRTGWARARSGARSTAM